MSEKKNHPYLYTSYLNAGIMYADLKDFRNSLKYILIGLIMKLELEGKL